MGAIVAAAAAAAAPAAVNAAAAGELALLCAPAPELSPAVAGLVAALRRSSHVHSTASAGSGAWYVAFQAPCTWPEPAAPVPK